MGNSLDELDSTFRVIAENILADAATQGLNPVIEDTGRTNAEQAVKLAQGVSWTGHSMHLPQPPEGKSKAIDIVPRDCMSLKYWGWNGTVENSHPYWGRLIEIGRFRGARCGADFPHADPGHFEAPRVVFQASNRNSVQEAVESSGG